MIDRAFLIGICFPPSPIYCSSIHSGTDYASFRVNNLFLHSYFLQVNLRDLVDQANFSVTEFLLLEFSNLGAIHTILFAIFLCLYLIILSGNITIVTVIYLNSSLQYLLLPRDTVHF